MSGRETQRITTSKGKCGAAGVRGSWSACNGTCEFFTHAQYTPVRSQLPHRRLGVVQATQATQATLCRSCKTADCASPLTPLCPVQPLKHTPLRRSGARTAAAEATRVQESSTSGSQETRSPMDCIAAASAQSVLVLDSCCVLFEELTRPCVWLPFDASAAAQGPASLPAGPVRFSACWAGSVDKTTSTACSSHRSRCVQCCYELNDEFSVRLLLHVFSQGERRRKNRHQLKRHCHSCETLVKQTDFCHVRSTERHFDNH